MEAMNFHNIYRDIIISDKFYLLILKWIHTLESRVLNYSPNFTFTNWLTDDFDFVNRCDVSWNVHLKIEILVCRIVFGKESVSAILATMRPEAIQNETHLIYGGRWWLARKFKRDDISAYRFQENLSGLGRDRKNPGVVCKFVSPSRAPVLS